LFGGGQGGPSLNTIHRGDGSIETLPVLLTRTVAMRKGDLFHHVMAGGGGYGDALERDPALVLDDVIEGKVTRIHASEAFGVVLADGPAPCVDVTATAALRAQLRQTRS